MRRHQLALATALLLLAPTVGAMTPIGRVLGGALDVEEEIFDPERETAPWGWVKITTDIRDAQLGGVVMLEGTAGARDGYVVDRVSIWVDRQRLGAADGAETWTYALDTRRLLDGPHVLEVIAWAAPEGAARFGTRVGGDERVTFDTLNHVAGKTLFLAEYELTGASHEEWVYLVPQRYTGLRVTVTSEPAIAGGTPPSGEFVMSYVDPIEESHEPERRSPERVWVATFGQAEGTAVVSRGTSHVIEPLGTLSVGGAFGGVGRVTLRVEALPLAGG